MKCGVMMNLMALGLASQVPSPVLPSDVYISVKTSGLFHNSRLPVLLSTWLPEAGHSAHLFTDAPPSTSLANSLNKTGAAMVETGCPSDHSRSARCCKMQANSPPPSTLPPEKTGSVTQFTPIQEAVCEDNFGEQCSITFKHQACNETVKKCYKPIAKCRPVYESPCTTKYVESPPGKFVGDTGWKKLPIEICGVSGTFEECHDKTIATLVDAPEEFCDLNPQNTLQENFTLKHPAANSTT